MLNYLNTLLARSTRMFFTVAKIMVPIMIIVRIADEFGLVQWIGQLIAPAMALLNLPPEAGIIWAATMLTSIYGGIASLAALSESITLTSADVSALGAMMLLAHNLPVEQAISKKAGASALITGGLRIGAAIIYAAIVSWTCAAFNWLQEPVSFAWLSATEMNTNASGWYAWWLWIAGTAKSLLMTWLIIIGLVTLLDLLERWGITKRITKALTPLLKLSGLNQEVAPVTTVGVMLGLSYGGALIIEESKRQNFSPKTRLLALSWLSLSHSLIEDTILVAALGANMWVLLPGRVLLTLLIISSLAWILNRWKLLT